MRRVGHGVRLVSMEEPREHRRIHWVELMTTLLLTLSAVGTAWASYQSSRWHGKQAQAQSASIAARVESTAEAATASRQAQVDLALFTQWIDAYARREHELEHFYRRRFRPEFKPAFNAWVTTRPLRNPKAPLSPFAMPQYKLAATAKAERLEAKASAASQDVKAYIQRADNYVLAVVLFAASLFFAGISARLRTQRSREVVLGVGWAMFLGTLVWLATFPVNIAI